MATAKQIAARKEFSRIMKSGGFGPKKAKAKPRKKNPVGRSGNGPIYSALGPQADPGNGRTMNPKRRPAARKTATRKNPSGRNARDAYGNAWDKDNGRVNNPSGRNSRDAYGDTWDSAASDMRANNPKRRAAKRNPAPTRAPVGFKVCKATAQGLQGALIAAFVSKADAVQYGKAYVKAHNRAVVIVGKSR